MAGRLNILAIIQLEEELQRHYGSFGIIANLEAIGFVEVESLIYDGKGNIIGVDPTMQTPVQKQADKVMILSRPYGLPTTPKSAYSEIAEKLKAIEPMQAFYKNALQPVLDYLNSNRIPFMANEVMLEMGMTSVEASLLTEPYRESIASLLENGEMIQGNVNAILDKISARYGGILDYTLAMDM